MYPDYPDIGLEFFPIPDLPAYAMTSDGRVWTAWRGRLPKPVWRVLVPYSKLQSTGQEVYKLKCGDDKVGGEYTELLFADYVLKNKIRKKYPHFPGGSDATTEKTTS